MYFESATNLADLSCECVQNWLNSFDAVLSDCDGVLWHEERAIVGSPDSIAALQKAGKSVHFVTNNGTKTRHELWQRATRLGYNISEESIISPTHSIVEYLKRRHFRDAVYIIGTESIAEELSAAGIQHKGSIGAEANDISIIDYIACEFNKSTTDEQIGAVIVGFDEHFNYAKLLRASNYLLSDENCLFLATNTDAVQKYPSYHIPGTGAIVGALEACVGRSALVLGKPNPMVCEHLWLEGTLSPQRTLIVGDCAKVDISFGKNCGFQTLLVGTGNSRLTDVLKLREDFQQNHQYIPDFYIDKLGDLLQYL